MKTKYLIFLFIASCITVSCTEIKEKNLTVIDNLVLGKKYTEFINQYDSLNIPYTKFYIGFPYLEADDILSNQMTIGYTKNFNLLPSVVGEQHYGIYNPHKYEGTDNIVELNVLLGHTTNAWTLSPSGKTIDITKETNVKSFTQCIREDLLDKIEAMLIKKYGEPDNIYHTDITFYYIDKKQTKKHTIRDDYNSKLLVWNTKNLEISFFKGIKTDSSFSKENGYFVAIDKKQKEEGTELPLDHIQAYEYSYLLYRLNDKTITSLELDKPNI